MFILTCKGKATDVYQVQQVAGIAKAIANAEHAPVTVDQFEKYLGDVEPQHHIINTVIEG